MKLLRRNNTLFLLLLLAFSLPLLLLAAKADNRAPSEAPVAYPPANSESSVTPVPDGGEQQQADNGQTEETVDIQTLKQRYNQDSTGVRARLGMCRQGQNGHGGGRHCRHRGGEQWNNQ
ncbi:hypothetical protein [uncultured Desulfobulbus sp.]|uniref:hypothetical protein n=1 Tax=uncultured Desulfobulbus sp. TaxID=239745 RepID=UPI0029C61701|nr:hypothetical protein [uncultured Desulfobulbus sp.]